MNEKVIIVRSESTQRFVDAINKTLERGYQLYGNVFKDGCSMCQLLVLQEEKEPNYVRKLVRDIITDVQEMQENGCSDGCHNIAYNLENMYKEVLDK